MNVHHGSTKLKWSLQAFIMVGRYFAEPWANGAISACKASNWGNFH